MSYEETPNPRIKVVSAKAIKSDRTRVLQITVRVYLTGGRTKAQTKQTWMMGIHSLPSQLSSPIFVVLAHLRGNVTSAQRSARHVSVTSEPLVLEGVLSGQAGVRVGDQQLADEVLGGLRNLGPLGVWELVLTLENLLEQTSLGVAKEW